MAGTLSLLPVHTCLLVLVPQQVALFYGDDGGPGLAAQLRVDQVLVVGQRGLWLDVNQGGAVSQVILSPSFLAFLITSTVSFEDI